MVDKRTIQKAARMLLNAAPPGSGVILFGSYARGNAGPDSDLDFLVVEPEVRDKHAEMVRLRQTLEPLRLPADVLVASRKLFDRWRHTPNNILHEAFKEGTVLHELG